MKVKLGAREVLSVNEAGARIELADEDTISVKVDLEPHPDEDWRSLWSNQDFPFDLNEPQLGSDYLVIGVLKKDLGRAWTALGERVAATNRAYVETVIPAREAKKSQWDESQAATKQRLEEAERLLSELE